MLKNSEEEDREGPIEEAEETKEDESEETKEDEKEGEEERVEPDIEVIRVGIPLLRKTKEAVLEGIAELYLQLRTEGFPIHAVHSDRGREFVNGRVKSWMRSRCLVHTTNSGEDPKPMEGWRRLLERPNQE